MTQEEKQLLFKDLCARLPYEVIVKDRNGVHILTRGNTELGTEHIKPYLRSFSSMTEEEKEEYEMLQVYPGFKTNHTDLTDMYDFLNSHYIDYRGLIEKGLALEAPEDMYKTE